MFGRMIPLSIRMEFFIAKISSKNILFFNKISVYLYDRRALIFNPKKLNDQMLAVPPELIIQMDYY